MSFERRLSERRGPSITGASLLQWHCRYPRADGPHDSVQSAAAWVVVSWRLRRSRKATKLSEENARQRKRFSLSSSQAASQSTAPLLRLLGAPQNFQPPPLLSRGPKLPLRPSLEPPSLFASMCRAPRPRCGVIHSSGTPNSHHADGNHLLPQDACLCFSLSSSRLQNVGSDVDGHLPSSPR